MGTYNQINGDIAASPYDRTGLAANTQRFYRVSAVDASGNESALSAPVSAVTQINPDPVLSINNPSVSEGDSGQVSLVFTLTLSAATDHAVTFNYATRNGTATAGQDYVAKSGSKTIPAGESSTTVAVQVIGDTIKETNETLFLDITNIVGARI